MAEIVDNGSSWKLVLRRDASPLPLNDPDYPGGRIDEWSSKGYKAVLGTDPSTGKHVVIEVDYDKRRSTLNDVAKHVDQLRTCGKCSTLDKRNLTLSKVSVGGGGMGGGSGGQNTAGEYPGTRGVDISQSRGPGASIFGADLRKPSAVKDMFANIFFDAYFTRAGKYYFGLMMGDDTLIDSALPKSQEEMGSFMNEVLDFMTGEAEFVRSPEEAKEFLGALRSPTPEETGSGKVGRKGKRAGSSGTVIY